MIREQETGLQTLSSVTSTPQAARAAQKGIRDGRTVSRLADPHGSYHVHHVDGAADLGKQFELVEHRDRRTARGASTVLAGIASALFAGGKEGG